MGSDCTVSYRKTIYNITTVRFILKEIILWRWLTHFTASFQINNWTCFMKWSEYVRREWVCLFHTMTGRRQFSERKQEQEGVWIVMTQQHTTCVLHKKGVKTMMRSNQRSVIHRIVEKLSVASAELLLGAYMHYWTWNIALIVVQRQGCEFGSPRTDKIIYTLNGM